MNKIFYVIKKKIPVHMLIIALLASLLFIFPASATSNWSMPRPSSYTVYDDIIARASTDGRASVGVGVQIADYIENTSVIDYDTIRLKVSVSANTRVGIQYDITRSFVSGWHDVFEPTGIIEDNSGTWLNLPFYFIFYGVKYERVWVCSNGFLSFDSESTNPIPQPIPNTGKPNSLVAPFWRDLNPSMGGSITYGTIYAELIPSQQIQLEFTLPNNSKEARTYILYTEGHYYTIP